jgi:hypothetical protein
MLTEYSEKTGERHRLVVRIIEAQGNYHNLGSICLGVHKFRNPCRDCVHLDLAHEVYGQIYLIGEIHAQGGDFRGDPAQQRDGACLVASGPKSNQPRPFPDPGHKALARNRNQPVNRNNPLGNSSCWDGYIYESWRSYRKPEHAVAYLKRYFDVVADGFNESYNQEWIDQCEAPTNDELKEPCVGVAGNRAREGRSDDAPPTVVCPVAPLPTGFNKHDILEEMVRWIHLEPFQRRRRYAGKISPVLNAPVVIGWDNRVQEYAYARQNGPDFVRVYQDTQPLINGLNAARLNGVWAAAMPAPAAVTNQQIQELAQKICIWGGVRQRGYANAWCVVRDAILACDNGSPMNSGWTKVASFASDGMPSNEQTIWDSRVATSIIWRIDQILYKGVFSGKITAAQAQSLADSFNLGTVASMSVGTRPRSLHYTWPKGYAKWNYHLSGSALVREIVEILNNQANGYPRMPKPILGENNLPTGVTVTDWTVFGAGLVLFMDGW